MPNLNYKDILSERLGILEDSQSNRLKNGVSNTLFGSQLYDQLEIHLYDDDGKLLSSNYNATYDANSISDSIKFNLVDNLQGLSGFFGNINVKANFNRNLVGFTDGPKPIITEISPSRLEVRLEVSDPDLNGSNPGSLEEYLNQNFDYFGNPPGSVLGNFGDKKILPVLNLGDDNLIPIVNWVQDRVTVTKPPYSIVVKFPNAISRDILVGQECMISQPVVDSVYFPVSITSAFPEEGEDPFQLLGPNFYVNVNSDQFANTTDYESYDSLLAADGNTKRDLINKYFSGSLQGVELGIDFANYNEFVHFSSAEERLRNFKYKLELVETYDSEIAGLSTDYSSSADLSGSSDVTASAEFITNRSKWQGRKDSLIGTFDPYEHYLYYESASYSTSSYGEFTPTTWPKTNSIKPYTLSKVYSSEAIDWFGKVEDRTGQIYSASLYDLNNPHILRNTIPAHIREKVENEDYTLFVDMMGQHYDILYNYIDHIGKLHNRDERLYRGLSKDLISDSLKSFGWDAIGGFDLEALWSYAFGTGASGSYASSSLDPNNIGQYVTSASSPSTMASLGYGDSVARGDITKEVWNRILTNLPYLYKTKGTKRGLQALMTCYGIPSTILQIREYGGPEPTQSANSNFQHDRFNYALNFGGGEFDTYINCDWNRVNHSSINTNLQGLPRMQEFRARFTGSSDYSLLVNSGSAKANDIQWGVFSEHSSSNTNNLPHYGRLTFALSGSNGYATSSTKYFPLYDGDWWNISLATSEPATADQTIDNQSWVLKVKKAADHSDGTITHSGSATLDSATDNTIRNLSGSYNAAWAASGSTRLRIGGSPMDTVHSSFPSSVFSGSMQEYRQYMEQLNDDILGAHALSPLSIVGNNYSASFDLLVRRYTLGSDLQTLDRSVYTRISSSHVNQSINQYSTGSLGGSTSASAVGFSAATGYYDFEETYYTRIPDLVGSRDISKKIRIKDNILVSQSLHPVMSFQSSSTDLFPLDSEKISISLSPTNNINLDIAYQFGGLSFDDFVGDPRDQFKTQYSELYALQYAYKKKLNSKYNIFAFLRLMKYFDKALFLQIERMLPARAKPFVGITIEPNLLERPKVRGSNLSGSFQGNSPIGDPPEMKFNISNFNDSDVIVYASQSNVPYYQDLQSGISASIFSDKVSERSPQYDGSMYSWKNQGTPAQGIGTAEIGSTFIVGSFAIDENAYWLRDPLSSMATQSIYSEIRQISNGFFTSSISPVDADVSASKGMYESSSFEYARVQDYLPTSTDNLFYQGSSLFSELIITAGSSSGIYSTGATGSDSASNYQSSSDVPDNKPVIEVFETTNNVYYVRTPGLNKSEAASPDVSIPFNYAGNDAPNPNKAPISKTEKTITVTPKTRGGRGTYQL
tara:strand:- start:43337 stop:47482 length:4146 start_codon:yes stop_codon:yes gene_type:complete